MTEHSHIYLKSCVWAQQWKKLQQQYYVMRAKKSPTDREPQASGLSTTKRAPLGHILILLCFFARFSRRVTVSFSNSFLSCRCSLSLYFYIGDSCMRQRMCCTRCVPHCIVSSSMLCIVLYCIVSTCVPCRAVLFSLQNKVCILVGASFFRATCSMCRAKLRFNL